MSKLDEPLNFVVLVYELVMPWFIVIYKNLQIDWLKLRKYAQVAFTYGFIWLDLKF